jgi:hypothetical protein
VWRRRARFCGGGNRQSIAQRRLGVVLRSVLLVHRAGRGHPEMVGARGRGSESRVGMGGMAIGDAAQRPLAVGLAFRCAPGQPLKRALGQERGNGDLRLRQREGFLPHCR